ncbi:magnesium-translocating P-type ATPase, partial [Pseudoduganella aquatica]
GEDFAAAAARLARYGPNLVRAPQQAALLWRFAGKLANPLVFILVLAGALSALTGDAASSAIVGAVVVLSVTLDVVQEYRAGAAAERLRQSVAVRARVLRDGEPAEAPLAELVPGDVVLLAAGDLVPCDGRVLEARDCYVNQALLTGESYPVEKAACEQSGGDDVLAAGNAVLLGTSVISGSARVLVCRTGQATALGEVARLLQAHEPPTDFERGTHRFGLLILRMTVSLVLFVLLVNVLLQRPLLESFLFAVALAVGLTPELLPMVVSVTLARGALRMAAARVVVKRLAAIQSLGSMDVLCTDKTGTLTEARIRLEQHLDPAGQDSARVLELAYLNSHFETGLRSPLDDAILAHGGAGAAGWRKIAECPFDFERRRVSVLIDNGATRLLVVKGAPEDILRLSARHGPDAAGAVQALDTAARAAIAARCEALGRDGMRVLGIAWREVAAEHGDAAVGDETALVFAGFATFLDPPKLSARPALAALAAAGVALKTVTGDNELVARHLFGQLGLPVRGVLSGAEIDGMDELALAARAERANLFCRVTPAQKSRILLALKRRGHVVGYLGDGINDAPALRAADVGVSVDGAADVAREAADMILLEHDLGVLHAAVLEGRRTFGNIMKYIMMGTSSNFGNMFSMAAASLLLPFLPMLPVQILLNNLLYDLSELPLPLDRVDPEYLARPQPWDMVLVRDFMLAMGSVSSVFDLLTFYVMLAVFDAGAALFQTGWFIESMATQVLVIFLIRTRRSPLRSRPHPALALAALAVLAVAVGLPYTALGAALGFVAPPAGFFLVLAGMLAAYLVAVEAVKQCFFRRRRAGEPRRGRTVQPARASGPPPNQELP